MIDEKQLIQSVSGIPALTKVLHGLIGVINSQPKIGEWILCKDKMPEEHDSIFAKLKGTDKWNISMFEKISDDVNVTVEYSDGYRVCKTLHTQDGEWNKGNPIKDFNVIAWQPLPDAYMG